ncbi:hypothetical protein TorRG33x02_037030 [Trema orientale]|uniref:Uncharacterized protein n=1 Tax=Trema orientale TaxID=63057 RepID=A0A2P5FS80_TREOI|nr:hypothetical protein TorRG33x02_037030 [Trema orientale]
MARRSRRDIELHLAENRVPKLQLTFSRGFFQKWTQVHPAEQPGIAFQALDTGAFQPLDYHLVPPSQPLPVRPYVVLREFLVREHGRQEMLRLGRYQGEARHPPRRRHDLIVVRVYRADAKTGEPEVLGEAVDNVDSLRAHVAPLLENLGNAHELRGREDGSRVDFVRDEVDVFSGGEIENLP